MKTFNMKTIGRFVKQSPVEVGLITVMLFAMVYTALPTQVVALANEDTTVLKETVDLQIAAMQNDFAPYGQLPVAQEREPVRQMSVPVTAYNSVPWQTDATPCIGAQGTDICAYLEAGSNTCAANFVPLGTVLEVESLGTCVVRDRMNARYFYRVDWYMGNDVAAARQFGLRQLNIGIYAS